MDCKEEEDQRSVGFEADLENFVGAGRKVVALSAGTAAIHLALIACGVKAGDEVCVTGRKPKAIIPVALYGMPYNIERIMEIGERYGIPVIEDAAEGFGSRWKGRVLGTFGKYGILSFNGNKMITTSGGGALICNGASRGRTLTGNEASEGTSPTGDAQEIMWYATQARDSYPYYQHSAIGYNYRMSNICAGIGRGQMTVAEEHIAHHKHVQGEGWIASLMRTDERSKTRAELAHAMACKEEEKPMA